MMMMGYYLGYQGGHHHLRNIADTSSHLPGPCTVNVTPHSMAGVGLSGQTVRALFLALLAAAAATGSSFNSSRTDCNVAWCTSKADDGGHDCWAGTKNEACTCSQGTATMTGDVKPNSEDIPQYKYTCCKNEPTDGMQCGDYDNDGCLPGEVRKSSPDGGYECITEERNKLEVYFAIICAVVIFGIFGLCVFYRGKGKDKGQGITPNENFDERTDESTNELQMVPLQQLSQTVEAIDLQQETVKICLDTNVWTKEKDKRKWGNSLLSPLQKRGVLPQEWAIIVDELQNVYEANPFVSFCGKDNAPGAECCYFCMPGGPIQFLLCLLNPITCCLYASQGKKKREAVKRVQPILEQRSIDFKIEEGMKTWATFECREGKFQQPLQQEQTEMQQPQQYVVVR